MVVRMIFLLGMVFAIEQSHARRFIHRHHAEHSDGDSIHCSGEYEHYFDRGLTPDRLWCNEQECWGEFSTRYDMRDMVCDLSHCQVVLLCDHIVEDICFAGICTVVGLALLVFVERGLIWARSVGRKKVSFD